MSRKAARQLTLLLIVFASFWFSGAAGWVARNILIATVPREHKNFRLLDFDSPGINDPSTGVVVRVSSRRLRKLAWEALGWPSLLLPPGVFPRHMTMVGEARIHLEEEALEQWMTVILRIDPAATNPRIRVSFPSDIANKILEYEGSWAHREKRRKYFLGHYTTIYSIHFDTLELRSDLTERQKKHPVTFRRIEGQATGRVRFKFEENLFNVRTTARVRRMELRCDLDFRKYIDGLALEYKIRIPVLDADIRNLAPRFEKRPVEALRAALEDGLGRPRNLERLARKRLPLYLPLDTDIELTVYPADNISH